MKRKRTNLDGFQTVLAFFTAENERRNASLVRGRGRPGGGKKFMADSLNISRQVADSWEDRGIPAKYIPRIVKLTGLRPEDILPEYFS